MAIEKIANAKNTFATLCSMLDNNKWKYDKDEEKLCIDCGAQGEDLPIPINIRIDAERQLILLLSHIPFSVNEDKRMETAVAVSIVNDRLVDGNFDYDITEGNLYFRMTSSFIDSEISEEAFKYMLYCSCMTIDEYNDKFLMLSKGLLPLDSFLKNE